MSNHFYEISSFIIPSGIPEVCILFQLSIDGLACVAVAAGLYRTREFDKELVKKFVCATAPKSLFRYPAGSWVVCRLVYIGDLDCLFRLSVC